MISLIEYILESILSNELSKELKMEKIDPDTAEKILSENDGFKKLGAKDSKEIIYWPVSQHYKIMYKNKCLGIFALFDFADIDIAWNAYRDDRYLQSSSDFTAGIFRRLLARIGKLDREAFIKKAIYVTYIETFPNAIKELDISPIATIKVFFERLIEFCKKEQKTYICANGKDQRVTSLYCKCGNFKLLKKIFNDDDIKFYDKFSNERTALDTGVYYII